jgi:glycosyltransferase involved in cell wall biosynthesis
MKRRILFVTSNLYFLRSFLASQIIAASETYEIVVVVNAPRSEAAAVVKGRARVINCGIERQISLVSDCLSIFRLLRLMLIFKPDIVHSTTPKAGLLAMVAARIARVPFRAHTYTGQVWQTRRGFMRRLLMLTDALTAACSSRVLADSEGQRQILIRHKIVSKGKSSVLGRGSICGVDFARFMPNPEVGAFMRKQLGIGPNDIVVLFMARFTVDKGALLMCEAFTAVCQRVKVPIHLVMVGPDEEGLRSSLVVILSQSKASFSIMPYTERPEDYFQCADVFCLPSFREGFPMVLVNAAACGVPCVASRIYGSDEAVQDGVSGVLFTPGDSEELSWRLQSLIENRELRVQMGVAARKRVEQDYSQERLVRALLEFYSENLIAGSKG